jgi:large subunit ribosomal protein L25
MAEVTLVAEIGRTTGSSASRRLRHAGRIPAVLYGHGMDPLSVSVVGRDLRTALSSHGLNQVLTLNVDGTTHLVLARQLQRHPVRHTVSHLDFQVVRSDEIVSAEVPLVIVGTATQVEQERGLVEQTLTSLTVHCTPTEIPEEVQVDVADLEIGGAVRVRDLKLPKGVTTDLDPEEVVVIATAARAEEVPEEEGAAGAEPGDAGETGVADEEG